METTDYSMLARFCRNELPAKESFFAIYQPHVHSWVCSLKLYFKNEQDREDLIQDVLLSLLAHQNRILNFDRDRGKFRSYLRTLVSNAAIDSIRRTESAKANAIGTRIETLSHEMDTPETETFLDNLEQCELHRYILDQMKNRLSEREWQGWLRTVIDGESRRVVGESLGMTPSAFSRMLSRTREKVVDLERKLEI